MTVIVKHNKTNTITDWTQAQLDEQIALGNFAPGTTLANIVLPSDWNNDHTLTGLGTMAEQDATAVAITGGTINNTTIGATTATTGRFTSVTTPSVTATTNDLTLSAISTGAVKFSTLGGLQAQVSNTASAVNYVQVTGGATGTAVQLSAQGSDTNISVAVQPKGTGALQAQKADSAATGGNARGANAVDWQTTRATAAQVASGANSFVGNGRRNTASSQDAFVGAGYTNTVSVGSQNVIVGGANNTNSSNNAGFIGSGANNTLSGDYSSIVGGNGNTTAGYFNFVGGGYTNSGTASAAVTAQSGTANATTTFTLNASNASIKVGQLITGTNINFFPPTYVAAISGTTLTLSQAATGSGATTLSFYTPHGIVVGGGNNQATGAYSFIGGGGDAGTAANRNTASGDYSFVGGGRGNIASGIASTVSGGGFDGTNILGNTASDIGATVVGGAQNTASGFYTVTGGRNNVANGNRSTVWGNSGLARGLRGNYVVSPCQDPIGSAGSAQTATLVVAKQTTDATATVLTSNGAAASTDNQIIMPNNSAYYFKGEIIAGVTGGGNTKGWYIEGVIKRGANAASTTLVGTPTVTSLYADAGAVTWTITATADTANGGLAITATGQAATTIRWVAQVRTTEMTY
jgi:hypothetical protein